MQIILANNRFVKDIKVSALGSIGRGYGVFETLRTVNKKPLLAKEHLNRLQKSAKAIGLKLPYSQSEILKQLDKVAQKSPHKTQRIKITLIPEALIIHSIEAKIDPKLAQGVKCMSIKCTRSLPEIKSISYLPSYLSHETAVSKGFHDALLLNDKNEVTEAAYANIFWFERNILCTPGSNILPGITRHMVLKLSPFKIKFKTITLKKLLQKKEIFLSSSITGITPITKIDNIKIGTGKPGINTKNLIHRYDQILKS